MCMIYILTFVGRKKCDVNSEFVVCCSSSNRNKSFDNDHI